MPLRAISVDFDGWNVGGANVDASSELELRHDDVHVGLPARGLVGRENADTSTYALDRIAR